jgi:hypothetical protein
MKFLKKFLLLSVIFSLLDPDPDSEYGSRSGSTNLIESGSNPDLGTDPDPEPYFPGSIETLTSSKIDISKFITMRNSTNVHSCLFLRLLICGKSSSA